MSNQSPLTFGKEALPKIPLREDLTELLPEITQSLLLHVPTAV